MYLSSELQELIDLGVSTYEAAIPDTDGKDQAAFLLAAAGVEASEMRQRQQDRDFVEMVAAGQVAQALLTQALSRIEAMARMIVEDRLQEVEDYTGLDLGSEDSFTRAQEAYSSE